MPQDLLRAAGGLVARRPAEPGHDPAAQLGHSARSDVETTLPRTFWLPTARTFSLTGPARISPLIPDDEIDRLVGRPGSDYTGTVAYSLGPAARRPAGRRHRRPWTTTRRRRGSPGSGPPTRPASGSQYRCRRPVTFDHLDLQVVADGQHSVPTADDRRDRPPSGHRRPPATGRQPGARVGGRRPRHLPAPHRPVIRITFDTVRIENTLNYYSQTPIAMPIGHRRGGDPRAPAAAPVPTDIPASCRGDLLTVDGTPVWVHGHRVDRHGPGPPGPDRLPVRARRRRPDPRARAPTPCDRHSARSAGFDIDQLALDSAPGAAPCPWPSPTTLAAARRGAVPGGPSSTPRRPPPST